jgi:hypothetical protein
MAGNHARHDNTPSRLTTDSMGPRAGVITVIDMLPDDLLLAITSAWVDIQKRGSRWCARWPLAKPRFFLFRFATSPEPAC